MEESDFSCANLERGVTIASVLSLAIQKPLTALFSRNETGALAGDGENYKIERKRGARQVCRLRLPAPLGSSLRPGSQDNNTPNCHIVARSDMKNIHDAINETRS